MELVEFILQDQVWIYGLGNQTFHVPLESSSKNHSRPWLALSLYIQQSHSASSNVQHPAVQPDSAGAFIFHRTLTEGPANTSRVVGRAQGFIIPTEGFAHSAFNVIYLSFESPQYSGSLSVQANHLSDKEKKQELVVVGGTGSFAFARGLAVLVLAQTHDQQLHDHAAGTYHVKLELRFPKGARTIPG
ncbi:dirigent protein 19 isoform X2 [Tripterygium wilfordii]|uniref:dirigent protein 19 isoform X2 n=1 Tax=Tripterygium wilfordii TaxID=458696 RepID=UPI0018F7FC0E|nr:dirigent protein 19 isoform X2 [Tripterygium wilfordii]